MIEHLKPGGPMARDDRGYPIAELMYKNGHGFTAKLRDIYEGCSGAGLGVVEIDDDGVWDSSRVALYFGAEELDRWSAMFATIAARVREYEAGGV